MITDNITDIKTKLEALKDNLRKVIVGNENTIDMVLTALLCGGHVLLEDTPGTGKTTLAKALAYSMDMSFSRIQFTPDLLPADITGMNIYSRKEEEFKFVEGPIMTNILLADEINRATPRTQSALLEAMQEGQVTVDGVSRKLSNPFFVIATQNPIETAGTFPLPEAQLDRFTMQLSMGFPTAEEEKILLNRFGAEDPLSGIAPVVSVDEIAEMKKAAVGITVHPLLVDYMVNIVQETRKNASVSVGASPRATISLQNAVKAYALISGRNYVVPQDIKDLAVPLLTHRMLFHSVTGYEEKANIVRDILTRVEVPGEDFENK